MKPTPLYRQQLRRRPRANVAAVETSGTPRVAEMDEIESAVTSLQRSHSAEEAKTLGAYYTHDGIAEFLTKWSIRMASDSVLDPSSGGGAFLAAAAQCLAKMQGQPAAQICGVDLDAGACVRVGSHFLASVGWAPRLHSEDFFACRPEKLGVFDCVVGNPPFIRYQQFAGATRDRALTCAARQGVKLNRLCSSWAPFVVHASAFVREGGRLAMVLPQELLHAAYAAPVLRHLAQTFRRVSVLTFQTKMFPDLSENTVLVLADSKTMNAHGQVRVLDSPRVHDLLSAARQRLWDEGEIVSGETLRGERRAIEQLLPPATRDLYHKLRNADGFASLGSLAKVGIGYVSGANDFFHPSAADIERFAIPSSLLRRAVCRGAALRGVQFSTADWNAARERGDAALLLELRAPLAELPAGVRRYLESGREREIHERYKCRVRKLWYAVPHVHVGDALLTYMSGTRPRLAANAARAVATNTLHVLRLRSGACTAKNLAAAWLSSITSLSVEIEGHALGGGMLKLEPTEAERVIVPASELLEEIPNDLAEGDADTLFLRGAGFDDADIRRLRDGARLLRARRGIKEVA